jgi:uncharacterized protein YegL
MGRAAGSQRREGVRGLFSRLDAAAPVATNTDPFAINGPTHRWMEQYANLMLPRGEKRIQIRFGTSSSSDMANVITLTTVWPKPECSAQERLIGAKMDLEHEIAHMRYTLRDVWHLLKAFLAPEYTTFVGKRPYAGYDLIIQLLRKHSADGWEQLLGKFATYGWLNSQHKSHIRILKPLWNIYADGHDEWRHKKDKPGCYAAVIAGYELGRRHGVELWPAMPGQSLWQQLQGALLYQVLPYHSVDPSRLSAGAWEIFEQVRPFANAAVKGRSIDVLHQALLTYDKLDELGLLDQLSKEVDDQRMQTSVLIFSNRPNRDAMGSDTSMDYFLDKSKLPSKLQDGSPKTDKKNEGQSSSKDQNSQDKSEDDQNSDDNSGGGAADSKRGGTELSANEKAEIEKALKDLLAWAQELIDDTEREAQIKQQIADGGSGNTASGKSASKGGPDIIPVQRLPEDSSRYQMAMRTQLSRANKLAQELQKLADTPVFRQGPAKRGRMLNSRRLYRIHLKEKDVFLRTNREALNKLNQEYILVADCSGSMSDNAENMTNALSMTHIALKKLGVKHAIWGFGAGQFCIKDFNDENGELIGAIPRLISGGTPLAEGIEIWTSELRNRSRWDGACRKKRIVFIVHDGAPDDPKRCADLLEQARRQGFVMFGVRFDQRCDSAPDSMNQLFGKFWTSIKSMDDIPQIVAEHLKEAIKAQRKS